MADHINFQGFGTFEVSDKHQSVLEVAIGHGIPLDHSCGGYGTCGTCRVHVVTNEVSCLGPRNEVEAEMAEERGFSHNERLACQIAPVDQLLVVIEP